MLTPMNTRTLCILAAALAAVTAAGAAPITGGPLGGRLLESEPDRAEFFVNAERRAEIRFYDAALKPLAPGAQVVSVTAEVPSGRVRMELEKTEDGFVTHEPLPAGEAYRIVVQVRATPEARPQNFRLDLNLGRCGGCARAEYACTCESH